MGDTSQPKIVTLNPMNIEIEVDHYMQHKVSSTDTDDHNLLNWWKTNQLIYPRLSKLAKRYLGKC